MIVGKMMEVGKMIMGVLIVIWTDS